MSNTPLRQMQMPPIQVIPSLALLEKSMPTIKRYLVNGRLVIEWLGEIKSENELENVFKKLSTAMELSLSEKDWNTITRQETVALGNVVFNYVGAKKFAELVSMDLLRKISFVVTWINQLDYENLKISNRVTGEGHWYMVWIVTWFPWLMLERRQTLSFVRVIKFCSQFKARLRLETRWYAETALYSLQLRRWMA
jgi:hypothetical protein